MFLKYQQLIKILHEIQNINLLTKNKQKPSIKKKTKNNHVNKITYKKLNVQHKKQNGHKNHQNS